MKHRIVDTGKVKIGSAYIPRQYGIHNADTDRVQRALIGKPRIDWDGVAIIVGTILFVVTVGVLL